MQLRARHATPLRLSSAQARTRAGRGAVAATALAIGAWVVLVVAGHLLGAALDDADSLVPVDAAPLFASFDLRLTGDVIPALVIAIAAVGVAPPLAARLPWRWLLIVAAGGSVAWALTLAWAGGGLNAIGDPLTDRHDFLHNLELVQIQSIGAFLSGFSETLSEYVTQVQIHPPGMLLALWTLAELGFAGPRWAAAFVIVAAAAAVPAAMIVVRELGSEASARVATPFLAFAPAAVWVATSADALFLGVSAVAVALVVVATGRAGLRADLLALAGGLAFGAALFLSYDVIVLVGVPLAVALARRRWRPLLVATTGLAAVMLVFLAAGFWWLDGLQEGHRLYLAGPGEGRPYGDFLVVNLGALALALGPAVAVGLARLAARGRGDDRAGSDDLGDHGGRIFGPGPLAAAAAGLRGRSGQLWLLSGAMVVAVIVADVSGLARGETERIWLPFTPWLLTATAVLGHGARASRGWLAAQVLLGLALQVGVHSPW